MKNFLTRSVFLLTLVCSFAGAQGQDRPSPAWHKYTLSSDQRYYNQWASLYNELKQKPTFKLKLEIADRERANVAKYPADQLLLFRWCIATYISCGDVRAKHDDFIKIYQKMLKAKPPYDYQYARMLFIIEYDCSMGFNWTDIGKRLAEKFPNDKAVVARYAASTCWRRGSAGSEAIALMRRCVENNPKDVILRFRFAKNTYQRYQATGSAEDLKVAIAEYRKAMAQPGDDYEQNAWRRSADRDLKALLKDKAGK